MINLRNVLGKLFYCRRGRACRYKLKTINKNRDGRIQSTQLSVFKKTLLTYHYAMVLKMPKYNTKKQLSAFHFYLSIISDCMLSCQTSVLNLTSLLIFIMIAHKKYITKNKAENKASCYMCHINESTWENVTDHISTHLSLFKLNTLHTVKPVSWRYVLKEWHFVCYCVTFVAVCLLVVTVSIFSALRENPRFDYDVNKKRINLHGPINKNKQHVNKQNVLTVETTANVNWLMLKTIWQRNVNANRIKSLR